VAIIVFYVYVLKSKKDCSQYIGLSQNVKERLKEHNAGSVTSTKPKRPWQLMYTESFTTRLEARKREKYLKSAAGRRFRKEIAGD
jgi:putative endonuclease